MKASLFLIVLGVVVSGCASVPDYQVPGIVEPQIPPLKLSRLKDRTIAVSVENARVVNQKAGNTADVEKVVKLAFASALERGGFRLDPASKNRLDVRINDCDKAPEGASCVVMSAKLKTPLGGVETKSESTAGRKREGQQEFRFGDVSGAYQGAIDSVIHGLDRIVEQASRI